jgi:hypothetical protein
MLLNWLGFIVGLVAVNLVGGYTRRFVQRNAPFYGKSNILVVGIAFGVLLGGLVQVFCRPVNDSVFAIVVLTLWGLLAALYIGYRPDPIDWANKSRQVAGVAALAYLGMTVGLFLVG